MDRRQLLLVAVLSVTCCVYAQQGQHTGSLKLKPQKTSENLRKPLVGAGNLAS